MRTLAALVVASVLGGCAAPLGAGPLFEPDRLGEYAPVVEEPLVPVTRSGVADGLLVHVHAWRYAAPDPERVPPAEGVRYVILDVSVRRVSPDAPSVMVQRFGVHAVTGGEPGPVFAADPLLTNLLPRALPAVVQPPVNVTIRGDVLAAMPPLHEPAWLLVDQEPLVELRTPGDDPAPPVEPTPGRLAPGAATDVGGLRVHVHALAPADGVAQHDAHAVLAIDHAYAAERVEDARGVSLGFLLRGADGRLSAPSVSGIPEWWDGTSGRVFEPGRAYRDVALMEAPASDASFEVWYAADAGAAVAWGPFEPSE